MILLLVILEHVDITQAGTVHIDNHRVQEVETLPQTAAHGSFLEQDDAADTAGPSTSQASQLAPSFLD